MELTAEQAQRVAVKFQQQLAEEKAKSAADVAFLQIQVEDLQQELQKALENASNVEASAEK